jgi:protein involved in polysaccharide export with SLBB domain
MHRHPSRSPSPAAKRGRLRARWAMLLALAMLASPGCAAMTNPVADSIRVHRLPPELLAPSKADEHTIPLNLLRQPAPDTYRLGAGDVLGVYIETILPDKQQAQQTPIQLPIAPPIQPRDQRRLPPAWGYPITVQPDGTIALPQVAPLAVVGRSLEETRKAILDQYVSAKKLTPDQQVSVTLMEARQYQVVVLRQETNAFALGLYGPIPSGKRGTGHVLDLPAYENDVLHALAQTGGLPGLDAYNEVVIMRDGFHGDPARDAILQQLEKVPTGKDPVKLCGFTGDVIRIPLRAPGCDRVCLRPDDIILRTGDVVFLEARDDRWFYTGGLLPPAKYELPRDTDLDVISAVAEVRGPLINGSFGGSNLSGDLVKPGIGNPSATLLVVLRKIPGGGQVPIRVDIARALRDPNERILVQAGDVLILQEKPGEAFARYFSQSFLNFDIFWQVFRGDHATGVLDVSAPDRLPNRVGIINAVQ